jgi:hypothetical protein
MQDNQCDVIMSSTIMAFVQIQLDVFLASLNIFQCSFSRLSQAIGTGLIFQCYFSLLSQAIGTGLIAVGTWFTSSSVIVNVMKVTAHSAWDYLVYLLFVMAVFSMLIGVMGCWANDKHFGLLMVSDNLYSLNKMPSSTLFICRIFFVYTNCDK